MKSVALSSFILVTLTLFSASCSRKSIDQINQALGGTPIPAVDPAPSATPSPSITPDPSVSPSPSVTATPEPSTSPSASPTPTATATAAPSASPLVSPTATPTVSPSPSASPVVSPTPATALILYDGRGGDLNGKFGLMYAILIQNLLGHFDLPAELLPVENYTAAKLENYPVTFYFGSYAENPLPAAFISDVLTTSKKIVWFKHNIWQVAAASLNNGFAQKFGFTYQSVRTLNATPTAANPNPGFFDAVLYKNKSMQKYYLYGSTNNVINADPDVGVVDIQDSTKATVYAQIKNTVTSEIVPYITHADNFWYMGDIPFTYIGSRDRFLVICDALHDMLGVVHAENHRALVRLEDVSADATYASVKTLADIMSTASVPFSIATIPFYRDPLGAYNSGVAQEIHLTNATALKRALDYALTKGGSLVTHGYTHQYLDTVNDQSGVSGDDFEFWNSISNSPVGLDSQSWALGRLDAAAAEMLGSNYHPYAWEPPHYQASPTDYKAFTQRYGTTYQRVAYYSSEFPTNLGTTLPTRDLMSGLFYPYLIIKDSYGQRIIPENLGSISYDIHTIDPYNAVSITWQTLVGNADYGLVVRDGFASFFFHPFWLQPELGLTTASSDFQSLINGIKGLGYTFIAGSDLATGLVPPMMANKGKVSTSRMPASVKAAKKQKAKPSKAPHQALKKTSALKR